jgi:hypothetical protein
MLELIEAARGAALPVAYGLHNRYRPGDYESWKYLAPNPGSWPTPASNRRSATLLSSATTSPS